MPDSPGSRCARRSASSTSACTGGSRGPRRARLGGDRGTARGDRAVAGVGCDLRTVSRRRVVGAYVAHRHPFEDVARSRRSSPTSSCARRAPASRADRRGGAARAPGPGATGFPVALNAGSTWDPELYAECSRAVAAELRAGGVHLALVSGSICCGTPLGSSEECYGEDPLLAAEMCRALVAGMQGVGRSRLRDGTGSASCSSTSPPRGRASEAGTDTPPRSGRATWLSCTCQRRARASRPAPWG